VEVNGIRCHYLDWGGEGEALLFLGGLSNTAHVFDDLAPMFTDRFRVVALTRRGAGQSDKPTTGYDTDQLVEDTVAFLDALKIERVHLVGFSLAGVELTRLAALHANRVGKLVYLDATPIHTTPGDSAEPETPRGPELRALPGSPGEVSLFRVNFQPENAEVPEGYVRDHGQAFGARGNGYAYGWSDDNTSGAREWKSAGSPDGRHDTAIFIRKQWDDLKWEIAVPGGTYKVRIVAGAPELQGAAYGIEAEGVVVIDDDPDPVTRWIDRVATVTVRDGRLTIAGVEGAEGNNLCFVEVCSASACPDSFRSPPRTRWPMANDVIAEIRAAWAGSFPGASVEPLVADQLESWVIRPDGTIRRRYPRRIGNLVDAALSLGDLAHIDDTALTKPALFLRAIPPAPADAGRRADQVKQESLKGAKLEAFRANGPHVQVVELNETSHLCFIQRKDEVARRMRAFLEEKASLP
jgi:pimeloyl-ACP methyl ester carboxylesterase